MSDAQAAAPAPAPVLTAASSLIDTTQVTTEAATNVEAPAGATQAAPELKTEEAPALVMPGKDATPEQWAEFYGKIGRPDTPEAYELPVPDGDDGAFAKQMAPVLHKHGVTSEQAKGLATEWNAMIATQAAEQAAADQAEITALDTKNKAEAVALKTEWGQQHEANMHFAKLGIQQFVPKEQAASVVSAIESVLGYKGTIQMMHAIGKGLGEHDAAGLGGNGGGQAVKSIEERLYGGSST